MSEFSSLNGYDVKDKVARSIAKGRNQAVAFGNYSTLITALNSLRNDEFRVGQNIYVVTVGVPDLWVCEIESTLHTFNYVSDEDVVKKLKDNGTIQVGYYRLATLEVQEVDLTTYDQAIGDLQNGKVDKTTYNQDMAEVNNLLAGIPVLKSKTVYGLKNGESADTGIPLSNRIVSAIQTKGKNSADATLNEIYVSMGVASSTTWQVYVKADDSTGDKPSMSYGTGSVMIWYI